MFDLLTKKVPSKTNHKEGVVTEVVCQNYRWRVYFAATYWFAESEHQITLNPGDAVWIVGRESATTLLVEPA